MARYRVEFIKKGIKIGQIVPPGATKSILVKNVYSGAEAKKVAKKKIAGTNWTILSCRRVATLDPDARRR